MAAIDSSTPVVVLGLGTHGSIGIMRTLGRLGVQVYGIHSTRSSAASSSRYCRETFLWDPNAASSEATVDFLHGVARAIGRLSILIPTADEGALFVSEHAAFLRDSFLFPDVSPDLVRSLISKKCMYHLAKRHDVPTAETVFPQSRMEVVDVLQMASFPVMLKGIDGNLLKRLTGVKMAIVHDASELLSKYDELEDAGTPNLMLQEYIPGGEDTIWMFNGYFNAQSDCLAGFTGKKIRQSPVYTGATSLGVCLANAVVEQTTRDSMKAIGYRGILDIGYRYDARDGKYKVLDINPRIGATFRLFADANDYDVARVLYLDITGQSVPEMRSVEGRKWAVEFNDVRSCFQYRRDGRLSLREWITSYRGVRETAYFAIDDLTPFFKECGDSIVRNLRRVRDAFHSGKKRSKPSELLSGGTLKPSDS